MSITQTILFYVNNPGRWSRDTLRRWKKEGRIPWDYCGDLRSISYSVEMEYRMKRDTERFLGGGI